MYISYCRKGNLINFFAKKKQFWFHLLFFQFQLKIIYNFAKFVNMKVFLHIFCLIYVSNGNLMNACIVSIDPMYVLTHQWPCIVLGCGIYRIFQHNYPPRWKRGVTRSPKLHEFLQKFPGGPPQTPIISSISYTVVVAVWLLLLP